MRFRIKHTEIGVSYTLLCLMAVCALLGIFENFLWCAAAIALHEGGHLLAMCRYGYFPERIKISLFEIAVIDSGRHRRRTSHNALIIFFGPFANFICFSVSYLLYLIGMKQIVPFAAANLSVGLFNSLPVLSLDGGQLLYLLLCRRHSPKASEAVVDAATFVCIFPLAALGFWMLLRSENNFSLLFVSVYLAASLLTKNNRYE